MNDPISLADRRGRRADTARASAPITGRLLSDAQQAVADEDLHGSELIAQASSLLESTVRTGRDGAEMLLTDVDANTSRLHALALTQMDQAASADRIADALDRASRLGPQLIADAITASGQTTAAAVDRLTDQVSRLADLLAGQSSTSNHDAPDHVEPEVSA